MTVELVQQTWYQGLQTWVWIHFALFLMSVSIAGNTEGLVAESAGVGSLAGVGHGVA